MKKELIDLAKRYSTDLNGNTILNCGFTDSQMALRIGYDKEISIDKDIYICQRIDGKEWKFKYFRQACVFHYIITQIGFKDDLMDKYYEMVKEHIGCISHQEYDYLQQRLSPDLIPDEDS